MKRVRRRVLFWIISGLLIAICAGSILLLRSITLPQRYKGLIEARLKGATGRDVWIRQASLRFLGGIGIEFEDLVIKDWDGRFDFIQTRCLILQMKILPLLRGQLRWKSLLIEEPNVWLRRSREGNVNFWAKGKGLGPKGEKAYTHMRGLLSPFAGGDIRVRRGRVHFVDNFVASRPTTLGLEDLYIEFTSISMDAPIAFFVRARQSNPKGTNGRIMITGEIGPLPDPFESSKIRVAAEVRAKNVNGSPLWPYYGPHIPMKGIEGFLEVHAHYEGDFSGLFRSWGEIRVEDLSLDYPQVFDTVLKTKEFVLNYDLMMTMENLIISDFSFRLPEIEIKGMCTITEIRSPRRSIEAFVTTGSFQFDGVKNYIPLGILSPGLGKFLGKITQRGRGRIVELRIEGPIKDFSMLEDPEKANLIYGKMRLDGMVYPFAKALRPVEDISGLVILEKGSLGFLDLKGYYGRSSVNAPEMIISRIYASPQLNLIVNGEINARGIADIARTGTFPGKGVPIRDISGSGDLKLRVAGRLSSSSKVSYNGHLALKWANLSIKGIHLPIAATSGEVLFSNDQLRLIGLRGKVGKSAFLVNGQLENPWFGKPGREYKGRMSLGKIIVQIHGMVSPIHFIRGYIDFTRREILFSEMEVQLKGSYLNIEGSVRDYLPWERAKIDLRIRAPNLDIGDFRLKEGGKGKWIWRGGIALPESGEVTLRIEEAKWRNTVFSNLTADITLSNGRLNLERFNCGVDGGEVDFKAWVDLDDEDGVAITLNPLVSRVDVGRFFRDLGLQDRVWITGAFYLWGSLTGRGHTEARLRRSLEGRLRVRMEEGRIRRFHILSKIFSLLNVSQIFEGKLPELTGEGLPYKTIKGEIGIARGIAKTENLLVDSDAMKITIIGEADIAREFLDLTVGLHPLGTVDTIVSKVPVVGRILTGENESIISYYVEVEGDFTNPEVKHIPLKSMEKGLIEIMRRLLETPKHIIPKEKGGMDSNSSDRSGFPENEDEPGIFPKTSQAEVRKKECDCLVVVGTSDIVQPVASFPTMTHMERSLSWRSIWSQRLFRDGEINRSSENPGGTGPAAGKEKKYFFSFFP